MAERAKPNIEYLLSVGDPETTRIVAVLDRKGAVVGAGCLLSGDTVLTCWHVVEDAVRPDTVSKTTPVRMRLCGYTEVKGFLVAGVKPQNFLGDLAILTFKLPGKSVIRMTETEFVTPFRHGGKAFSVVGFPQNNPDGYYSNGTLRGSNVAGLVQLDGEGKILVQGGFSGAPVWSSDLSAYVGIIVSGLIDDSISWCIPSRAIARFYPKLPVRFRLPKPDRPDVHDFGEDDPNIPLFGNVSQTSDRRLSVTSIKKAKWGFRVDVKYECLKGSKPRGRLVTFITHPSFSRKHEDAYELFSEVENGVATTYFWTKYAFTIAAIGDGGDTALTYDIATSKLKPADME